MCIEVGRQNPMQYLMSPLDDESVAGEGETKMVWGRASQNSKEKGAREILASIMDGSTVERNAK